MGRRSVQTLNSNLINAYRHDQYMNVLVYTSTQTRIRLLDRKIMHKYRKTYIFTIHVSF